MALLQDAPSAAVCSLSVPRNYQGREIRAFAPEGHLGRTTLRRARGRRGTGTSKAASDARRVRAGARAGRLDRAFSPFCGTPCGACPPSGRQRVICVTMALSYNRGCTMALWLRRSLSKRKAPTASSCFQAAGFNAEVDPPWSWPYHLSRLRCGDACHLREVSRARTQRLVREASGVANFATVAHHTEPRDYYCSTYQAGRRGLNPHWRRGLTLFP
jgi:hypothetical protein